MANQVLTTDKRHPMLRQLDLELADNRLGNDECLDISFMSRSFCLSGLPLRRQFLKDPVTKKVLEPRQEEEEFSRYDGSVSLTIGTLPFVMPDGSRIKVGVPYGARARLLILWMVTQARAARSNFLEIGRIDDWLNEIGIASNPDSVESAKEQLIRLSFANFTMVMERENFDYFRTDRLIESVVFQKDDIINSKNGNFAAVRFPLGIELSNKAFQRFTGSDVIPVSTEALRKISNNAMSIDIFLYLSYRLPLIAKDDSELLSWGRLSKQFGSGEPKSRFRQVFDASISKALDAYQGADVDITDEGLVLRYSDPAKVRQMFVVNAKKGAASLQRVRTRNRIAPPSAEALLPSPLPAPPKVAAPKQMNMEF